MNTDDLFNVYISVILPTIGDSYDDMISECSDHLLPDVVVGMLLISQHPVAVVQHALNTLI